MADEVWPISLNMKHRATMKGNKLQTQTDRHAQTAMPGIANTLGEERKENQMSNQQDPCQMPYQRSPGGRWGVLQSSSKSSPASSLLQWVSGALNRTRNRLTSGGLEQIRGRGRVIGFPACAHQLKTENNCFVSSHYWEVRDAEETQELNCDLEAECYKTFNSQNNRHLCQVTLTVFYQSGFRDKGLP